MSEEEGEEQEGKLLDKINNAFVDFVGNVFGESGKEWVQETQEKIKDFSSSSIKKFMEFSDDMLEKLNLHENESIIKTRDSIEDMLKQSGLLKEEEEEDF
jgi:predicted urease superfamily metal-dependent hydrolase